jgi:hypothetical protein
MSYGVEGRSSSMQVEDIDRRVVFDQHAACAAFAA